MIYLDNTQDLQEVWVPRNDGIRATRDDCFSTGYDSGYTDGFNDGRMSGASLQEKAVDIVSEVTEILPDEGYDGMSKVTANASGYGDSRYNEGYNLGMEDGRNEGREEGREEILSHIVPTAVTMDSESISFEVEDPNYGFSEVTVNASEYGSSRYNEGYNNGKEDILSRIGATAITENGVYEPADTTQYGWSSVTVNVPTGTAINNQTKSVSITANSVTNITYDSQYTGLENVEVTVNVPQTGVAINNQTKTVEITANGKTEVTYDSGFTGLEKVDINVNVPQSGGTGKLKVADYPGLKVGYSRWTEVPDYLDFEGVTDMSYMFAGTNLSGSQTFDLSGITTIADMFNRATSITALTLTGADDVEAMNGVAYECTALESFEMYGACRPTRMDSAFYNNVRLKEVILPDTSKVTKMENMFYFCNHLTGVTLNTDSVTDINGAFMWCTSITEIHLTSLANIPTNHYMGGIFSNCSSLEVFTLTAWPDTNLDNISLQDSPLTHDSIVGLLNALPQSTGGYSFQIGQTNIAKLTDDEIAIATDKGWSLV